MKLIGKTMNDNLAVFDCDLKIGFFFCPERRFILRTFDSAEFQWLENRIRFAPIDSAKLSIELDCALAQWVKEIKKEAENQAKQFGWCPTSARRNVLRDEKSVAGTLFQSR